MQTYRYKGRNRRGELLEGTIESPSAQAVARWLLDTSHFPVTIELEKPPKETPPWLARLLGEDKVRPLEIEYFTRQVGTLSRAGLSMLQAIQSMQRASTGKGMARILRTLAQDLDKGASLSQALSRHHAVFGDFYLSMIRVGEESSRLNEVWQMLLRQLEFDRQMRQRVSSVMRYPSFVLAALVVALLVFMLFVIPVFADIYKSMRLELPAVTQGLIAASGFVTLHWWGILAGLALGALGASRALRTPQGRYAWDKAKLRLPLFGPIMNKGAIGRFCEGFATAYRSGVPLVQAIDVVSGIVDNAFIRDRVLQMRQGLERGQGFSRVARGAGIFSQTELQMIIVGEEAGAIDMMVSQIARIHQEDLDYDVNRLSKSMEPLLLGFMGGLVGLLLLGIFTPMWDMSQLAMKR